MGLAWLGATRINAANRLECSSYGSPLPLHLTLGLRISSVHAVFHEHGLTDCLIPPKQQKRDNDSKYTDEPVYVGNQTEKGLFAHAVSLFMEFACTGSYCTSNRLVPYMPCIPSWQAVD